MPAVPASVRLALWVTSAWAGRTPTADVLRNALPDVDHVAGDLDRLELWRTLGEQALLVGLPAPGDLTGLPVATPEALGAAATVGECVFVPGLGGMLVPTLSTFGTPRAKTAKDTGLRVDWTAYDAQPVARHRIEALDASTLERHLREQVLETTEHLTATGGQPFGAEAARTMADAALGGRWGLPEDLPSRARRVIVLAGTVGTAVDLALMHRDDALDVTTSGRRRLLLQRLQRDADRALADATNLACAVLAGWRPA